MQFSVATVLTTVLAAASTASALAISPVYIAGRDDSSVTIQERPTVAIEERPTVAILEDKTVDKRAVAAILNAVGSEAAKQATKLAVKAIAALIKDILNWNSARQAFTRQVTKEMMAKRTSSAQVAAACYNKSYKVQNPDKVDGKTSVSFKLGALHTNYDCMYLLSPNTFWTNGEGGYQNLAYSYTNACKFDSKTQDLTCQ